MFKALNQIFITFLDAGLHLKGVLVSRFMDEFSFRRTQAGILTNKPLHHFTSRVDSNFRRLKLDRIGTGFFHLNIAVLRGCLG